ncbi:hypothetical protein KQX54_014285 [Cotesia glomerata]|uniref:Uncharacterized protein n=1 Tax=Cotesia glomerata TaxID=32391 RepID=A0AAV7J501_COTGL|nr:hypothetical protein KQX54_014285 [Cotesia glomerata]
MNLLRFVYDCQNFYGESFITFNVHSLLHIVDSVRKNGPSSVTSTYVFENNIFNLKQKVSGPNGVMGQVANRTLRYNNFQKMLFEESDESCREFCEKILNKRRENVYRSEKSEDGALMMDYLRDHEFESSGRYYSRDFRFEIDETSFIKLIPITLGTYDFPLLPNIIIEIDSEDDE